MINEARFRLKKNGEPNCDCFCRHPELIENYDLAIADKTQTWECHHRFEALFTKEELIKCNWYYDIEPNCLIFLTKAEHRTLHHKGKKTSEETKRKFSEAMKNRKDLSKKVLCVETGGIFDSMMDAERQTGINNTHISQVCLGKRKTTGGYHWRFCN